ncbi:MAG: hypothetical protein ACI86M_002232 [Saprospiraceae bacterium]|jgi:hypothetical protein
MEKSALHRITSLVLAILMLFTSVGFSADLHFCKGELKSFSLFGKAESCHTVKRSCPHHADMVVIDKSEKDCCSNKTIEVDDLDTNFNVSPDVVLTDLQVKFVNSFVYSFISSSLSRVVRASLLATHDLLPPRDIYVLLERFLI